ncbi:MAG: molybdopterin-dependent oxidoreductase, partial [Myxococcota bacterium]
MRRRKTTFCRICEAHCGLVVDIQNDQILDIKPDENHPLAQGYSCIKGLGAGAIHHDPNRVDHPLKRVGNDWYRISWDTALAEIGTKVRSLRRRYGDRAVGMYAGNPTFFSFQNVIYHGAFLEALGSPNLFSSHSIDSNPKLDVATQMYGLSMIHPIVDLDHNRFLLCLGSNPMVSQMSFIQVPNAVQRLREIEARGRVVIVDPRRTETADRVGEHLSIVPGSDVYLLLGMAHHLVHRERGLDRARIEDVARGFARFADAVEPWSVARCAALTGIDEETIVDLALALKRADGGAIYMSTGVNMGPFGSLAYWLIQCLGLITGQIDRKGGMLVPHGAFDALTIADALGLGKENSARTRVAGWHQVAGCFPVGALAEEIQNDHPDRIRALFVSCGNPVHSVPSAGTLREALQDLELLVAIDLYRSETAELAHYILPATDMLERSDFPVSWQPLQPNPFAQYTEAVVEPKAERRPEWQIFSDLAIACGAPLVGKSLCTFLPHINRALTRRGRSGITPDGLLALLLRWGGKTSLAELKRKPSGIHLPPNRPGSFLKQRVRTPDRRVDLAPPRLMADLPRLERYARNHPSSGRATERLYLIGRRHRKSHNSWMHNNRFIRQPSGNRATMHPVDAAARGLEEDAPIRIANETGATVELPVRISDEVARGVVAVPHGWGHEHAPGLERARAL